MIFIVVPKALLLMAQRIPIGKMRTIGGFAYIALLASLAVIMLVLTAASENISQTAKREREKQLLFVGKQFRNAIASYYENAPQGNKQFPKDLDVLVKDNRSIKPMRHLRRIYIDPMTNDALWGLVKNGQQRIVGVYSLSTEQVLITNIDSTLVTRNKKQKHFNYSEFKFIYTPQKESFQGAEE